MRTQVLAAAFLLLFSWLNYCCQKPVDSPSVDSSTITVLYPWDDRVLGPNSDVDAKLLVFLPLFTTDEKGHMQGKLAEKWVHSEDYRSWTFYLRQDVNWHDGVLVTAHDIKFTLELISRPDIMFDGSWLGMQSITVHDDHSLTIIFEWPKDFLDDWLVYWPKHILENLDPKKFWKWDFWNQPVGNGPYRCVRHVPKTLMEFEANFDYYDGKPEIERVFLKFGSASSLTELLSGNVDVLMYFNRSDIPKLAKSPQFRTYYHLPNFYWLSAVYWNMKDPIFSDPKVRRALTMAVDRVEILRVLNMPEDLKIFDVVFTGHQYRHDEIPPPLPHNQEAAVQLLDEAGWREGNDGVLKKDGQDFRFEIIIPTGDPGMGAYSEAATLIQAQFRRIGIQMDIQVLEGNLLRKRIMSGQFQAAINSFFQGANQLLQWFGEDSPLGYNNPRVIQLLKENTKTVDPEEVNRIFSEIMPLMAQDLPLTFLFPQIHSCVVHKRIKGLSSPYRAYPLAHMEHLWIEEEE
ncbi:MAG: peptide ABC transporter substrate-binding protein [Deltaproteobacteria bacterium]|nr:peptide ABC transporter substrate-binding protein [Deltaproteobacteria bacterium]